MMDSSCFKLDPEAIQRRASSIEGCQQVPTVTPAPLLSFLVGVSPSSVPRRVHSRSSRSSSFRSHPHHHHGEENDDYDDDEDENHLEDDEDVENLARVTVFFDTGTVCISRVFQGQVRHIFRRQVDTLDGLERLLRKPPHITPIDHTLVGLVDDDDYDDDINEFPGDVADRKKKTILTFQSELELSQVGLAILQGEKAKLQQHLFSVQQQQQQQQQQLKQIQKQQPAPVPQSQPPPPPPPPPSRSVAPAPSLLSSASAPPSASASASASHQHHPNPPSVSPAWKDIGMEFQFALSPASMKHVDQCLHDIMSMNKMIRGVATNGRGTVFLYGNGGVAYTPNIPRPLHQKLSHLRSNTRMSSRPSYVSLGSKDRYFCAFHDGSFSAKGPKSLDKELKKLQQPPLCVAFGSTWDAWFVVFHDGSWKFQGQRGIPQELSDKLAARKDRGDLVCVTLGPNGEWFLKAKNGRMWWGGLSEAADAAIQALLRDHELRLMDFGEDGSYFVSYD